ncbi:MAG: HTH domain-containing protein [Bacteroidetes bacterium]|nr:HTH domain-containing protein [Bacteroidota bacterium]
MRRVERLTAIITFLQSRKNTPIERLQEKFRVSKRTIYRDITSLHEIGVPVSFQKDRGYFILDSHFMPPVSFSENEAIALILAGTLMKRFSDNKTNEHFENALDKVKYALSSTQKDTVETIVENIKTPSQKEHSKQGNYLFIVQNAITNKQILNIKYKDRKDKLSDREIEPIGLTFYGNEWHTVAFCWKRNEYRDYKIKISMTYSCQYVDLY